MNIRLFYISGCMLLLYAACCQADFLGDDKINHEDGGDPEILRVNKEESVESEGRIYQCILAC